MKHDVSIASLLQNASRQLIAISDVPKLEAELLLSFALNRSREYLFAHSDMQLMSADASHFLMLLSRRLHGEPLAYITGEKEFWSLSFDVSRAVLIPRPETELLVMDALAFLNDRYDASMLELGTGSGVISISIAHERPDLSILAVDVSEAALDLAKCNATKHGVSSIQFMASDWYASISHARFDVIVSNPPYLSREDGFQFGKQLEYEPDFALYSGEEGLDAIQIIIQQAPVFLKTNGLLLLEHGHQHTQAVQELFFQFGFVNVQTKNDLSGLPRVTRGVRK